MFQNGRAKVADKSKHKESREKRKENSERKDVKKVKERSM